MAARDLVEQQRAEQLLRDAKLAAELARQYGPAWERMRTEILQILAVVEKARAAGETVDTRWLLRKGYLDRLEKLVTFQTRTFLDFTARKVQAASVQAALDGQRDAAELVAEAAPGDVPKPLLETSYAVNNLAAGKPLRHLLDTLPGQVGSQAAGALLEGVVLGLGPREIARDIRKVATIPLTRALLISRTETLRVYRQAAFDRYRQSADVLTGWVWLAKLDDRTCPVCIALHGTKHELSEEMATHPNCRCSMAPLTEPWTDPDLPDTRFTPQTGEAWFKNLSPERQRAILGPGKFALYESGELKLADLVQPTEHVVWGKGVRERSLRDLGGSTIPEVPANVGITRNAEPFTATLDPVQIQSLRNYIGNEEFGSGGYELINRHLRGQTVHYAGFKDRVVENIAQMDSAIAQAAPNAEPVQVFRAFATPDVLPAIEPGGTLTDKGFMSTFAESAGKQAAETWAGPTGDVWEIELPPGTKALDFGSLGLNRVEKEILLPRGSVLDIVSVDPRETVFPNGNKVVSRYVKARLNVSPGQGNVASGRREDSAAVQA